MYYIYDTDYKTNCIPETRLFKQPNMKCHKDECGHALIFARKRNEFARRTGAIKNMIYARVSLFIRVHTHSVIICVNSAYLDRFSA